MDIQPLKQKLAIAGDLFTQRPYLEYVVVGLFLSLAAFLIHGHALDGFWRMDDGEHLRFASLSSPWQYFFIPEITRIQSGANVTPWNVFFYDINLWLFGMNPRGHYAHLHLLISTGTILLYAVLRQWLPLLAALAGALALLLGKPTLHLAEGLMHGHYATGFALSMLSILGWTRCLKGGSPTWRWVSVGAYLLATTCKEIYVPLVVLLPFLPVGSWRERWRMLIPFLLVALVYVGWRYAVLGHLLGGYQPGAQGFDPRNALLQLASIPRLLTGTRMAGMLETGLFVCFLAVAAWRSLLNWWLIAISIVIVILPLVPLTIDPGIHGPDRYLFLPWLAISVGIAVLWPRNMRSLLPAIGALLLILVVGVEQRREEDRMAPAYAFWDSMYQFALSADKQRQAIFVGHEDAHKQLYQRYELSGARAGSDVQSGSKAPGTLQVFDNDKMGFNGIPWNGLELFQYRDGAMTQLPATEVRAMLTRVAGRYERGKGKPLSAEMHFDDGIVRWQFGPDGGRYYIDAEHVGQTALPPSGRYTWPEDRLFKFHFCYEHPRENWIGCSPQLSFDPKDKTMSWAGESTDHPPFN